MQVVADLVRDNASDDPSLSVEERISNAVEPELLVDAMHVAQFGYDDPQKGEVSGIDVDTPFGRRRAEVLFGPNALQWQGKFGRSDSRFSGRRSTAPSKNDPIGIGVDQEGEGDDSMFELINQDEDDEPADSKNTTADNLENEQSGVDLLLDGE